MTSSRADVGTIGVLALRHTDKRDPKGNPWGFFRLANMGATYEVVKDPGGLWVEREAQNSLGALMGDISWPFDPSTDRKIGQRGWAFAVKSMPTASSQGSSGESFSTVSLPPSGGGSAGVPGAFNINPGPTGDGSGGSGAQRFRTAFQVGPGGWSLSNSSDDKLAPLDGVSPDGESYPGGFPGLFVPGTDLAAEQRCFIPAGGRIVAPHWGGKSTDGTLVYDVASDGNLDKKRKARLQSLTRVYEVPTACAAVFGKPGEFALAIQLGKARGGFGGRGVFSDDPPAGGTADASSPLQFLGSGSKAAGGFLSCGYGQKDKHHLGVNSDGEPMQSLHISTNAYFERNAIEDAPIKFDFGSWQKTEDMPGTWFEIFLRYDKDSFHGHPCRRAPGLWRLEAQLPFYGVPDQPPRRTPTGGGGGGTPTGGGGGNLTGGPGGPSRPPSSGGGSVTTGAGLSSDPVTGSGPVGFDSGGTPSAPSSPGVSFSPSFTPTGSSPVVFQPTFTPTPSSGQQVPVPGLPGIFVNPNPPPVQFDPGGIQFPFGVGPEDDPGKPFREALRVGLAPTQGESTARKNTSAGLYYIATVNELAAPGFLIRPQNTSSGVRDLRNSKTWGRAQAIAVDATTPVVGRLEGIGNNATAGTGWNYTTKPGQGRYQGGSSNGGAWFLPPEIGMEAIVDGKEPSVNSSTTLGLYKSYLAFGKPLNNGLGSLGHVFYADNAGNTIVLAVDVNSYVTYEAMRYTQRGVDFTNCNQFIGRNGLAAARGELPVVGETYFATDTCADYVAC